MTNERIQSAFSNPGAFISFLTGGDPDYETSLACAKKIAEAGSALIEIGIPFSDPTAEGPVIEQADTRALANGMTTDDVFEMIRSLRKNGIDIPIVLMTYYNPVFVYGIERFLQTLKEAGGDGLIVPDLPFEESTELREKARKENLCLISLVAPTSNERIRKIAKAADGFLYVVSSLGTTGVRSEITTDIPAIINEIRSTSDIPTAVGFGISTPEQAATMCKSADGVIVGSAIVKIIDKYREKAPQQVYDYVQGMVEAARKGAEKKKP